ncbi:MAG: sulfurtransferase TusA family protein [Planctomycetes bacterium]|nr:sulfurtransferase TusA family protein [Planctomycetota bacterium]
MEEMTKLDVRGYSCPIPAQRTKLTLRKIKEGQVEILVDAGASKDNVIRTAERLKFKVLEINEFDEEFFQVIFIKK